MIRSVEEMQKETEEIRKNEHNKRVDDNDTHPVSSDEVQEFFSEVTSEKKNIAEQHR